jgi:hypothetical protein
VVIRGVASAIAFRGFLPREVVPLIGQAKIIEMILAHVDRIALRW